MIKLSKSPKKNISTQAIWWLNFRKTNDWADLMNWESISTEHISSNMKKMLVLKEKLIGKNTSESEKIAIAKEMAKDPDGATFWLI